MESTEEWDGEVVNESLNPSPGSDGDMIWYACPPSSGFAKVLNSGVKLRLVNGKDGSSRSGMAVGDGERMCMKCMRSGVGVGRDGDGGGEIARRNCGRVVFRWDSMVRQS